MLCVLLPLGDLLLHESIRHSPETGQCPDAEDIVDWLTLDESDGLIITISPVSSPVVYYALRHDVNLSRFDLPSPESIRGSRILVSEEQHQSPESVLESLGISVEDQQFDFVPEIEFGKVTVYFTPLHP